MDNIRIVVTGIGIVSPNGIGKTDFTTAIKNGHSGITHSKELEKLQFSCQIAGTPQITEEKKLEYLSPLQLRGFNSSGILYGCMAGIDAWKDAGFEINKDDVDFNSGMVFGAGSSSVDKYREAIYKVDDLQVRRLGSTTVIQTMSSGVSAFLSGILGLGNQISTNSSACSTGTEAILMGYDRIKSGRAKRMLVGSTSDSGPYIWGGFDAMRILPNKFNDQPKRASQPMSASACGFVPSSGAGALVLESLESAQERGAHIYAEILGGHVNSGGQRNGGTMTAPNSEAVQRCIKSAIQESGISAKDIDVINGHLTATIMDPIEIKNWVEALNVKKEEFPHIFSLKSQIGHGLSASGSIETVASVIQLDEGFLIPSINCDDIHPDILDLIPANKIPLKFEEKNINTIIKASFGFGDVNACLVLQKYTS
jgi:3-oxoacyl-(acyl-carrier-protein) synthase